MKSGHASSLRVGADPKRFGWNLPIVVDMSEPVEGEGFFDNDEKARAIYRAFARPLRPLN